MHLAPLIHDLAIILGIAGVTSYIFRKIKQPVVLGYLVAGFVIGPHTPPHPLVSDLPNIQVWAELGIIFVMFSLGLDFSFHKLARVGRSASLTALGEVLIMLVSGYTAGQWLGWSVTDSFFLGGVLSISSTTMIFKAFDEQKLRARHFADQVFGILIVEDLLAVLLLVALTVLAATRTVWDISLFFAALRLAVVVGSWFVIGYFVIPAVFTRIGRFMDSETWTVLSIGLCLLMVVAATEFGYSPALGAFILGSILAETKEGNRIEHLIRPLRDLFAAIFFVSVGMLVDPKVIAENWRAVLILASLVISGKIIGVTLSAILAGQPLRSSVRSGFSLAQIGEFSFIIASLGVQLKATGPILFPLAVAVSTLTAFTTPYLIRFSLPVADWLEAHLPEAFLHSLGDYASRFTHPTFPNPTRRDSMRATFRFALCASLITLVFVAVSRAAVPILQSRAPEWEALLPLAWVVVVALTAPFVYGMFFAFAGKRSRYLGRTVTLLWLAVLSASYFDTAIPYVAMLCLALLIFFLFYERLGGAYFWLEKRLAKNLSGATETKAQRLVPWDLRLYKMSVHPNSSLIGQTLLSAHIRQKYAVNVLTIQRGHHSIPTPGANEAFLPMDTLLVLGTEDGVAAFQSIAENPAPAEKDAPALDHYRLEPLLIDGASTLRGKTIRDSGLRQNAALIVGMERQGSRTTAPDPETLLAEGDVLWLVVAR